MTETCGCPKPGTNLAEACFALRWKLPGGRCGCRCHKQKPKLKAKAA